MLEWGRMLMGLGLLLFVVGFVVYALARWGIPLGRLPGDVVVQHGPITCVFPLATSLLLSLLLTLVLNVLLRGWGGK